MQERLAVLVEHQAIARLPDGVLHHVAHAHGAFALAAEVEGDGLLLRVVAEGDHLQRLAELAIQDRIQEAQALDVGQLHLAHALGTPEVELLHLDDAIFANRLLLFLHADDGAGHGAGLAGGRLLKDHFDLLAARLVEDLGQRGIAAEVDGEGLERLLDGRLAVEADGTDLAAAEVLDNEALEQVVDILDGEGEVDVRIALDVAFALEIADAAIEEDDAGHGELRG